MDIPLDFAATQVVAFMFVIARLSGLFLIAPVFSSPQIPGRIKVMMLFVLGATLAPIVSSGSTKIPTDIVGMIASIASEALVGLALGFAVSIVFSAIQVAASLIDTSIGFSMATIIDPLNNAQGAVLGSFYSIVGTLAFLSVQGHHWLLAGFKRSYDTVPLGTAPDVEAMLHNLFATFGQLFGMAFQIAAPVLVSLLLVDVVLGIVSRVVPQMNVFFVGIPVKIGVGLVAIIITLPSFTGFLEHRVSDILAGASVVAGTADEEPATTAAAPSPSDGSGR